MTRWLWAFVVLMSGFAFARSPARTSWVEIRSPHFSLLADGSERQGREIASRIEQMRSVFNQLFVRDPGRQAIPLQVIALKDEKEISRYAPRYRGKPVRSTGFYLQSQDRNFILLDMGADNLWETVYHEYSHYLLNTISPNFPVWFTEGFAEFYSTTRIVNRQAMIGRPPAAVMTVLREERLLPVSTLLKVDRHSAIYNDDHHERSIFYAESWLLVHYLLSNDRMRQATKYFELVRRRVDAEDAMRQAFGMEPRQLDAALERYLRAGIEPLRVQLPEGLEKVRLSADPVPPLHASATLADVHSHQPDYRRQSIREFEEILRKDPANFAAHRGLGYALLYENDSAGAAPHLKQAAEASPGDWLSHYYWASLMAQKQEKELAPAMEREARMVTRLNPEMADGHALLGFALMTQRKTPEATTAYETAFRLNPASDVYALNLAELYTLQGMVGPARKLFLDLQYSDNPVVANAARSHLDLMSGGRQPEMN